MIVLLALPHPEGSAQGPQDFQDLRDYTAVDEKLANVDPKFQPMVDGIAHLSSQKRTYLGTAFHIGNGWVLTAGHSIGNLKEVSDSQRSLSEFCKERLILTWRKIGTTQGQTSRCLELKSWAFRMGELDYALLKTDFVPSYSFALEREDFGKDEPIWTAEQANNGDRSVLLPPIAVQVFGHPKGDPLHQSTRCQTRLRNGAFYPEDRWHAVLNCQLIGGFSGGPVIDQESGKVLGIFITSGGWVTKISSIPELPEN